MTPEQEAHLSRIQTSFDVAVDKKYRAGQAEHGGDLFSLSTLTLLEEGMKEAIDQYVYLFTAREKLLEGQVINVQDITTR